MSLVATKLDALDTLITAQILATTPRITYKGAEAWKRYGQDAAGASTSRRFRLVWEEGNYFPRGIFSRNACETLATLRVRVDYVGEHERLQHVRQDDLHQLRDRMQALTADGANGLVLVQAVSVTRPPNWAAADAGQFDLVYSVRYLQARG